MTALTKDRMTPVRNGTLIYEWPVAAGVTIYRGALVVIDNTGAAKPGVAATGLVAVGRAETGTLDITPTARVRTRRGIFAFANSTGADLIGAANWGAPVYIVDDQTLALTNGGGTRSQAGICRGLDEAGRVYVEI